MIERLVTVGIMNSAAELEAARMRLEAEGIPCHTTGTVLFGAMGNASGGIGLQVPGDQAERAVQILESVADEQQAGQEAASASWICPKCSAEVPGSFDICWSCGAAIDDLAEDQASSDREEEPSSSATASQPLEDRAATDAEGEGDETQGPAIEEQHTPGGPLHPFWALVMVLFPPLLVLYAAWKLMQWAGQPAAAEVGYREHEENRLSEEEPADEAAPVPSQFSLAAMFAWMTGCGVLFAFFNLLGVNLLFALVPLAMAALALLGTLSLAGSLQKSNVARVTAAALGCMGLGYLGLMAMYLVIEVLQRGWPL